MRFPAQLFRAAQTLSGNASSSNGFERNSTAPTFNAYKPGLLLSLRISDRSPLRTTLRSRPLLGGGKVLLCDMRGPLRKIVSGFEIPAKEPDLATDIPIQERLAIRVCELTMDLD